MACNMFGCRLVLGKGVALRPSAVNPRAGARPRPLSRQRRLCTQVVKALAEVRVSGDRQCFEAAESDLR